MLVKAHDKLRRELDPELLLVSFFQYPSVSSLARQHRSEGAPVQGKMAHAGRP